MKKVLQLTVLLASLLGFTACDREGENEVKDVYANTTWIYKRPVEFLSDPQKDPRYYIIKFDGNKGYTHSKADSLGIIITTLEQGRYEVKDNKILLYTGGNEPSSVLTYHGAPWYYLLDGSFGYVKQ